MWLILGHYTTHHLAQPDPPEDKPRSKLKALAEMKSVNKYVAWEIFSGAQKYLLFSKVDWIAKPVSRYLRPDSVLRTNINQDYCIRDTQAHVQSSLQVPAHHPVKDLRGSFRYPLAKEGVYAPGGGACLAHFRQKFNYIVDLTVLRLAFFMGYG